jgi:hypothetical protein
MSISRRGKLWFKTIVFMELLMYAGTYTLPAQSEKRVIVASAHGGTFVLIRADGQRESYNPLNVTTGSGIEIKKSDMLQTPSGVFVEVRALPGNVSIRIAENSSLVFDDVGGSSSTQVVTLVYGRIRVDQEEQGETVIVKAGVSITEVQKGSINIDYIVNSGTSRSSQPLLYVSAISGSAVLVPSALSPAFGRVKVDRNEMLIFDAPENKLEKTSINKEIVKYWQDNQAAYAQPDGDDKNVFVQSGVLALPYSPSSSDERVSRLKTGGIITGLILMLAGVAVQTSLHYTYDQIKKETADLAYFAGFLPIGMGAFILTATLLYPTY